MSTFPLQYRVLCQEAFPRQKTMSCELFQQALPFFARGAEKTKDKGIPLTCHFSLLQIKIPRSHFLWIWSGSRWGGKWNSLDLPMERWKRAGPLPLVEQGWGHFYPLRRLSGAGSRPMRTAARITWCKSFFTPFPYAFIRSGYSSLFTSLS